MTLDQWLALPAGFLLFSFVFFAFRQGFQVKPDYSKQDRSVTDFISRY